MIGRNKNWTTQSDWMKEFNKKHNPDFYGEATQEKKTKKKKTSSTKSTKRHPIFKVQD
tara:strand:+ start:1194 stop:1367 length:174 start_codon:yes stop_codon:yes gene_type:complete